MYCNSVFIVIKSNSRIYSYAKQQQRQHLHFSRSEFVNRSELVKLRQRTLCIDLLREIIITLNSCILIERLATTQYIRTPLFPNVYIIFPSIKCAGKYFANYNLNTNASACNHWNNNNNTTTTTITSTAAAAVAGS